MRTILTIVGARPQFIKAAPVSKALKEKFNEILLHTGQHYDYEMSAVFFDQLQIPEPDINLNVGSLSHGKQTAEMIVGIENAILELKPDLLLIYGDTNSTLSAAIAASKLDIPIAHVEAGLRNFDKRIPEEINRIVADKLSTILFAPTITAIKNLENEGIKEGVYETGDVMLDSYIQNIISAKKHSSVLDELEIRDNEFYLATIHRAENTNNIDHLFEIIRGLNNLDKIVIFPIHPRTRQFLESYNDKSEFQNIRFIKPVGYLDFLALESNAFKIITDSGGVQKEAYFLKTPCITIFPSSSWPETVRDGWNTLVNANAKAIFEAVMLKEQPNKHHDHYGDGTASLKIARILDEYLNH